MAQRAIVPALLGLVFSSSPLALEISGDKERNSGQDITWPLFRFDACCQYRLLMKGYSKNILAFRDSRSFLN
jgi:hypothetical protein